MTEDGGYPEGNMPQGSQSGGGGITDEKLRAGTYLEARAEHDDVVVRMPDGDKAHQGDTNASLATVKYGTDREIRTEPRSTPLQAAAQTPHGRSHC